MSNLTMPGLRKEEILHHPSASDCRLPYAPWCFAAQGNSQLAGWEVLE